MAIHDLRKEMWCNPAVDMSLLQRNVDVCTVRMTKCVEHMFVLHMHLTLTANHCESSEALVTIHCNNAQRLASFCAPCTSTASQRQLSDALVRMNNYNAEKLDPPGRVGLKYMKQFVCAQEMCHAHPRCHFA